MPIYVLLNGYNGRMGRMFAAAAYKTADIGIIAGTDIIPDDNDGVSAAARFKTINICDMDIESLLMNLNNINFDIIVDFSHPSALEKMLALAISNKKPLILATTGYTEGQQASITQAAKTVPVFQTANMSIGINLMSELIKTAASTLSEGYDIEIVETHHNQKLDAPSGTAYMLADAIKDGLVYEPEYTYDRHSVRAKRGNNEIGIHSVRGGTIVGEHEVIFAGNDEVLKISHSASSRILFAEGAIRAVRYMAGTDRSPGRYSMRDVIHKIS